MLALMHCHPVMFGVGVYMCYLLPNITGLALLMDSIGVPAWLFTFVWDVLFIGFGLYVFRRSVVLKPTFSHRRFWLSMSVAVVIAIIAGNIVATSINMHMVDTGYQLYEARKSMAPLYVSYALSFVLAPLCEELVMRGGLYGGLRERFGVGVSMTIASLAFACAHGTLTHMPLTILLGLMCCAAFERSSSVVPGVIIHMVSNVSAVFLVPHLIVPLEMLQMPIAFAIWLVALLAVLGVVACCVSGKRPWYYIAQED